MLTIEAAAAISAANTAAAASVNTAAALAAVSSSPSRQAAPVVVSDGRDHVICRLEEDLVRKMRSTDIIRDKNGFYLFNLNQAAYVIEKSSTCEQKNSTRKRMAHGLSSVNHVTGNCTRSGKGTVFH